MEKKAERKKFERPEIGALALHPEKVMAALSDSFEPGAAHVIDIDLSSVTGYNYWKSRN